MPIMLGAVAIPCNSEILDISLCEEACQGPAMNFALVSLVIELINCWLYINVHWSFHIAIEIHHCWQVNHLR